MGGLLGAAVLGASSRLGMAAPKSKDKRQRQRQRQKGNPGTPRPCFPGTNCLPGQGRDNAGCDFSDSTRFFEGDFSGSDFSGANFTGAQLAGARLHGADLGGACLVGANLQGAELDGAELDGAIFCRTLMPNGTIDDSGCDRGTRCCPTECAGGECGPNFCVTNIDGVCSIFGFPCCGPKLVCTPNIIPVITTCEVACDGDADCKGYDATFVCRPDAGACPFLGKCCRPPVSP